MQAVLDYSKPLVIVQMLNIKTIEGVKITILYLQDIHSFKILYYKVFNNSLTTSNAIDCIKEFLNTSKFSEKPTFTFLKGSPFINRAFLNMMELFQLETSYYKRSETLNTYFTHKLTIKGIVITNPNNLDDLIQGWNETVFPNHDRSKG